MKPNKLTIAARIKAMKLGDQFIVVSESERTEANKAAKNLRDAGVIEFEVVTKQFGDKGYKVIAV